MRPSKVEFNCSLRCRCFVSCRCVVMDLYMLLGHGLGCCQTNLELSYRPFWTCTTLIFVAASIATFVTYLFHKWHKMEWNYDINLVTWSAGLFCGYVMFVPLPLYVILKYFLAPAGLVQLWCLYGYSLFSSFQHRGS